MYYSQSLTGFTSDIEKATRSRNKGLKHVKHNSLKPHPSSLAILRWEFSFLDIVQILFHTQNNKETERILCLHNLDRKYICVHNLFQICFDKQLCKGNCLDYCIELISYVVYKISF